MATDAEKLTQLKSAVAGLNQIRYLILISDLCLIVYVILIVVFLQWKWEKWIHQPRCSLSKVWLQTNLLLFIRLIRLHFIYGDAIGHLILHYLCCWSKRRSATRGMEQNPNAYWWNRGSLWQLGTGSWRYSLFVCLSIFGIGFGWLYDLFLTLFQ